MAHGGYTAQSAAPAHPPAEHPILPESAPSGDGSRLRVHLREWRSVYLAFAISRFLVIVVGWGAEGAMRISGADPSRWRPFAFAETYPHYADVAQHGYTAANAVNYPVLPALMAAGASIGVPMWLVAFVVSNLAFLGGLLGFAMLGERYVGAAAARRGATYLALAPFAYWFSITSTESLMLLFVAGSALLALRATPAGWFGAGALAAAAAMTRPPGALIGLLLLGIAISQLHQRRLAPRGVLAAVAAGAMIPAAVIGFFAYLGQRTGDTFAALHAQADFNRHVTLDGPLRALESGARLTLAGSPGQAIELLATFGAAVLIVVFLARAAGNRGEVRGWVAFGAASLLLPLATGVLWQMPRFVLLVPPVLWLLGALGERRWLHRSVLVLFPVALAVKVAAAVVGVEG